MQRRDRVDWSSRQSSTTPNSARTPALASGARLRDVASSKDRPWSMNSASRGYDSGSGIPPREAPSATARPSREEEVHRASWRYYGITVASGNLTGLPVNQRGFDLPPPQMKHVGEPRTISNCAPPRRAPSPNSPLGCFLAFRPLIALTGSMPYENSPPLSKSAYASMLDPLRRLLRRFRPPSAPVEAVSEKSSRASLEVLARMEKILAERPFYVNLETTTLCNSRCTFCAYPKVSRPKTIMTMELFEKVCRDFEELGGGRLGLSPMMSDPLTDPFIVDRVRMVRDKFKTISITLFTNLIGMARFSDATWIEMLMTFQNIDVSIGGFERAGYAKMFGVDKADSVFENLVRLGDLRNNSGSDCVLYLHVRTTDIQSEYDHPRFKHLKDIGFICTDVISEYSDFGGIVRQDDLPLGAVLNKADHSDERRACAMPSAYLGVAPDGQVAGCACFDGRGATTVGDARQTSLAEIWKGDRAAAFRNSFADDNVAEICRTCVYYQPAPAIFANRGLQDFDYLTENIWHKLIH